MEKVLVFERVTSVPLRIISVKFEKGNVMPGLNFFFYTVSWGNGQEAALQLTLA